MAAGWIPFTYRSSHPGPNLQFLFRICTILTSLHFIIVHFNLQCCFEEIIIRMGMDLHGGLPEHGLRVSAWLWKERKSLLVAINYARVCMTKSSQDTLPLLSYLQSLSISSHSRYNREDEKSKFRSICIIWTRRDLMCLGKDDGLLLSWHPNTFLLPDLNSWRTNFWDLTFSPDLSNGGASPCSGTCSSRYLLLPSNQTLSICERKLFSLLFRSRNPKNPHLYHIRMCVESVGRKGRKAYSNVIQFMLLNVDSIIDYVWLLY